MSLSHSTLDEDPLVPRRPIHNEATFDITAMIDLVFMMNIFFLVTTVGAALAEIDLPTARHCAPADRDNAVVITLLAPGDQGQVVLYAGDGEEGPPIVDPDQQDQRVREAVEAGARARKSIVIIKAEKRVQLRDVTRVGAIAVAVPGTDLRLSVVEME